MSLIADQLNMTVQHNYLRWKQANLPVYMRKELNELKSAEITDRFYKRMTVGVQGMIGKSGAGTNRMNMYTVRQLTQAFAEELLSAPAAHHRGVVIGYDSQLYSRSFAEQAALVLIHNGISVYLFEKARPAPVVSFAVRWLHTAAGIVISSQGSNDSYGYRIYTDDGAPMTSAESDAIQTKMDELEDEFMIEKASMREAMESGRLVAVGDEIDEAYAECISTIGYRKEAASFHGSTVPIVFMTMQKESKRIIRQLMGGAGFTKVYGLTSKELGDHLLPGSLSISPENWNELFEIAYSKHAELVFALNSEVNELQLAVRDEKGKYQLLNANQTGALLLDYICSQRDRKQLSDESVMRTIFTSDLIDSIAKEYHLQSIQTLTGFVHKEPRHPLIRQLGTRFILGLEETGGYMAPGFVRDKDAIQCMLLIAEMSVFYKCQGKSLLQQLQMLYQKHGYYENDQFQYVLEGIEGRQQLRNIIQRMNNECPEQISQVPVKWHGKYQTGGKRSRDYQEQSADVFKCIFQDGSWYAVQLSEMKSMLTLYLESRGSTHEESRSRMAELRSSLLQWFENVF